MCLMKFNYILYGKGIFSFKNDNRYEGDFLNDKRTGNGIFHFNNGNRFEAHLINDKDIILASQKDIFSREKGTKKYIIV